MSLYFHSKQVTKKLPFIERVYQPLLKIDEAICQCFGSDPEFVVAGTGRSGTVYIAWLLNALGVPTRHEYFFGPEGYHKRIGVKGDVSWMAVPYLDQFEGKVLHQTRHPIKTINSFVSVRSIDSARKQNKYIQFIGQHFALGDDLLENAMRFYIEWNKRAAEYAVYHFQLETMVEALPEIFEVLGYDLPDNHMEYIKKSQKMNSKSTQQVTYADLPKGALLDELAAASSLYGYDISS